MLHRTPYGSPPYGPDAYRAVARAVAGVRRGQDSSSCIRTCAESSGPKASSSSCGRSCRRRRARARTDESTDTYDTIDWLVKNVPNNNGRVGQWGISYPGSQTVWGMIDAHPALKASSPQAPAIDMFLGDDFHHNGAFRLMYTFSWLAGNARPRAGATETRGGGFDYGTPDGYRFFLDAGPVANINEKYFNDSVPTWNEYMDAPELRRVLAAPESAEAREEHHARGAQRRRLVRRRGLLRSARDLPRGRDADARPTRTASSSVRGCTAAGRRCPATRSATSASGRAPASTTAPRSSCRSSSTT